MFAISIVADEEDAGGGLSDPVPRRASFDHHVAQHVR